MTDSKLNLNFAVQQEVKNQVRNLVNQFGYLAVVSALRQVEYEMRRERAQWFSEKINDSRPDQELKS